MALPTNSAHLSAMPHDQMVEEYAGKVDSVFAAKSIMRSFVSVDSIQGTDSKFVRRIGKTTLKKVAPGVRPAAAPVQFGRAAVTVDTLIMARENRDLLNDFQTDFNARMELAKNHGKELGSFFDQAFLIQGIKGSKLTAPTDVNSIGAGHNSTMASGNDHLDPDKLYKSIKDIIVAMEEASLPTEEMAIFVRPTEMDTLSNNTKLVSRDFSKDNGDFADGTIKTIRGVPLVQTVQIPTAAESAHLLGSAYNVSATEAKAKAVILHPQSLLAGETIPLTSDVHYSKTELQWFIDSYMSFGVANRRPDLCGAVFAA